jgi:hypothetical protein
MMTENATPTEPTETHDQPATEETPAVVTEQPPQVEPTPPEAPAAASSAETPQIPAEESFAGF